MASGNEEAIELALDLYDIIENTCCDSKGYLECFSHEFKLMTDNEKLSENGVNAKKTMNTLLHVFEACTALYEATQMDKIADKLKWIMDTIMTINKNEISRDLDMACVFANT